MPRTIKYKITFTKDIPYDGKDKTVAIYKIKDNPEDYEILIWDTGDVEHVPSTSGAELVASINVNGKTDKNIYFGQADLIEVTDLPDSEYLDYLRKLKYDEIANIRLFYETNGTVLNGMHVKTDRESQAMITGAALQAINDPSYTCNWKTEGGFVTLNATILIGIAKVVREHVQKCFDKENELINKIRNASTEEEINNIKFTLS